jgi:hypothetical protein
MSFVPEPGFGIRDAQSKTVDFAESPRLDHLPKAKANEERALILAKK